MKRGREREREEMNEKLAFQAVYSHESLKNSRRHASGFRPRAGDNACMHRGSSRLCSFSLSLSLSLSLALSLSPSLSLSFQYPFPSLVGQKYPTTIDRRLARPDCCSREIIGHFPRMPRRREARGTFVKSELVDQPAFTSRILLRLSSPKFPPYFENGNAACENVQHPPSIHIHREHVARGRFH